MERGQRTAMEMMKGQKYKAVGKTTEVGLVFNGKALGGGFTVVLNTCNVGSPVPPDVFNLYHQVGHLLRLNFFISLPY